MRRDFYAEPAIRPRERPPSSLSQQSPSIEAQSQIALASDLAVTFGLYLDTYYDKHNSKT